MARCKAFTKDGKLCRMPGGADGWCFNHRPDPEAQAAQQAARSRGGKVGKARTLDPDQVEVNFESTQDVTHLLADICQWVLTGRVDAKTANAVVYAASAALRSLDQGDIEQRLAQLRTEIDALKDMRGAA